MFMAGVDPLRVNFFDESSVTKTTPTRNYGHSSKGQPAIEVKHYSNPVLANSDIVVMDNYGFYHGQFAADELRRMLGRRGIELVFQPPYSPNFNKCEFCFRYMKLFLRKHEQFYQNYTELAIIEALQTVTPTMSQKFFQQCGFVILSKFTYSSK